MKHTSTSQPSLCTTRLLQEYFNNGTLPAPGTVCKPDADDVVFPPPANRTTNGRRAIDDDDKKLLGSLKKIQQIMPELLGHGMLY